MCRAQSMFRITHTGQDRWIVIRSGALVEHGFPTLEDAVSFIRHESDRTPAAVELRIGELYAVAFLDPDQPRSLFGEGV